MASSRYDDFRYYDGGWKIPSQVKVYNGSSWIDYGEKTSHETKQIQYHNGSAWKNALYNRIDTNLPGYVQLGSGKYIDLKYNRTSSPTGTYTMVCNTSSTGYYFELDTTVTQTSQLYTMWFKVSGGNTGYVNYGVDVSGTTAKFKMTTYYNGAQKTTTSPSWDVSTYPRVTIKVTRTGGDISSKPDVITIYAPNGTKISTNTHWNTAIAIGDTYKSNISSIHRLGSTTTNASTGAQTTGGNAIIHRLKFTPTSDRTLIMDYNFESETDGATQVNSSVAFQGGAFAQLVGCTVTRITNTTWTKP